MSKKKRNALKPKPSYNQGKHPSDLATLDNNSNVNLISIIPIMIIMAIVPIIVYLKIIPLDSAIMELRWGDKFYTNFFSYYKMMCFLICIGIAFISLMWKVIYTSLNLRLTWLYIPLSIYLLFLSLSTMFSEYTGVAIIGFPDRFEGLLTHIGYVVGIFILINLLNSQKHIYYILGALGFSSLIIGIIGLFQFLGFDFFNSDLGRNLILPASYSHLADKLSFTFENKVIYATLYNPNYVGSFTAMIIPASIVFFLNMQQIKHRLAIATFILLMTVTLIGSHSRGGLVGVIIALLVVAATYRRKILKEWPYAIGIIVLLVATFFFIDLTGGGNLRERIISDLVPKGVTDNQISLDAVNIENDTLTIETIPLDKSIYISYDKHKTHNVHFTDYRGNSLLLNIDDDDSHIAKIKDEKYNNYTITFGDYQDQRAIKINIDNIDNIDNTELNFIINSPVSEEYLTSDDKHNDYTYFSFINSRGEIAKLEPIEKWGFEGMRHFGSNRGYIWSRSIPLIKNSLILGYGPDTFAFYFPQHDYIGKLKYYNKMSILVDKAHNIYIQTAINGGMIALIAFLVFVFGYIISSLKLYATSQFITDNSNTGSDNLTSSAGLAIFAAVIGYLTAGLFNDSAVSVAPVFWVLIGVGIRINMHFEAKFSRKANIKK